jgi:dihydrofolate synthase/folylpolyglutamate synthase
VLYAEAGVDAVVWETGLGGRLDATRLVRADVCAITTISLEHTAILGPTIAAIAAEKAGILRPRAPVALGAGVPEAAVQVIEQAAAALRCPVHRIRARGADVRQEARALARLVLDLLAALDLVPLRTPAVDAAIDGHAVEGRFQRVGNVLLDGAHSLAACAALARELLPLHVACLVFGATSGRDAAAMAAALRPAAERLVLTRPPGERGVDPAELLPALGPDERMTVVPDPAAALRVARQLAGDRLVVVAGSLYLIGRLLADTEAAAGDATRPAEYRSA